jgi:hypothetical protein
MTKQQHIKAGYLIPGQSWPIECGWLYDTISRSRVHAEIGVDCGRSLWASVGGMKSGAQVYAIDNGSFREDPEFHPDRSWGASVYEATLRAIRDGSHVEVIPIRQDSIRASQDLARAGILLDSVFIDGCHAFAETLGDIECFLPLIRRGGIICGHDYDARWPGVMDAVNYAFGEDFFLPAGRIWAHKVQG